MSYVAFDPNTEKTRFDLTAMMQEWSDFTQTQCGYEELDAEFVARLTAAHMNLFSTTLHEEVSMIWNPIEGLFAIDSFIIQANGGKIPLSLEELDLIWHDSFNSVQDEQFDEIEGSLLEERLYGMAQ